MFCPKYFPADTCLFVHISPLVSPTTTALHFSEQHDTRALTCELFACNCACSLAKVFRICASPRCILWSYLTVVLGELVRLFGFWMRVSRFAFSEFACTVVSMALDGPALRLGQNAIAVLDRSGWNVCGFACVRACVRVCMVCPVCRV